MSNFLFFLRLFIWFSLRDMRKHMGRVGTVLFGIALGAAVFTSMRLSVNASLDSFTKSMDLIAGQADYVLTRPGGHVPENLVTHLWIHPAIQNVSPVLTTYTRIAQNGSEPFLLIGFDPILDRPLRSWRIAPTMEQEAVVWFDLLKEPATIILAEPLMRLFDLKPGDRLRLEHVHQRLNFKIIGMLEQEGLALAEGGRIALTDIATFQEFTGLFGASKEEIRPFTGANTVAIAALYGLLEGELEVLLDYLSGYFKKKGRKVVTGWPRVFCGDPGADHAFVRDVQLQAADTELFPTGGARPLFEVRPRPFLQQRLEDLRGLLDHLYQLQPRAESGHDLEADLSLYNDVRYTLLTVAQLVIDIAAELSVRHRLPFSDLQLPLWQAMTTTPSAPSARATVSTSRVALKE